MMAYRLTLPIVFTLALTVAASAQETGQPSASEASPPEASGGSSSGEQSPAAFPTPELVPSPPLVYRAELSPADLGYRSVADASAGLPRTCSSCADATCSSCRSNNAIARYWRNRAKPFLQETHWGYCEYFDEPPFGAATRRAIMTQIAAGWRAQLVLYQFDFLPVDGERPQELSVRGRRELVRIADKFQKIPAPIVIEQSPGNPVLDTARRQQVLQELRRIGVEIADEAVVMGSAPGGLSGPEAVRVYDRFLEQSGQTLGAGAADGERPTMSPQSPSEPVR